MTAGPNDRELFGMNAHGDIWQEPQLWDDVDALPAVADVPTCSRCGAAPLIYDKVAGLWRVDGVGSPNCEDDHFPAWRHCPGPLTDRQQRAYDKATARRRQVQLEL